MADAIAYLKNNLKHKNMKATKKQIKAQYETSGLNGVYALLKRTNTHYLVGTKIFGWKSNKNLNERTKWLNMRTKKNELHFHYYALQYHARNGNGYSCNLIRGRAIILL